MIDDIIVISSLVIVIIAEIESIAKTIFEDSFDNKLRNTGVMYHLPFSLMKDSLA
jgi:hypothetical protein